MKVKDLLPGTRVRVHGALSRANYKVGTVKERPAMNPRTKKYAVRVELDCGMGTFTTAVGRLERAQ